jgi:hypothetical protein
MGDTDSESECGDHLQREGDLEIGSLLTFLFEDSLSPSQGGYCIFQFATVFVTLCPCDVSLSMIGFPACEFWEVWGSSKSQGMLGSPCVTTAMSAMWSLTQQLCLHKNNKFGKAEFW